MNTLKVIYGNKDLTSVVGFPPNITKITLLGGLYLSQIVTTFGGLSKLRYLKVLGDESGDFKNFKLECTVSGSFPQLQVLKMTDLNFVSWNMGESAMPQLIRLVIYKCECSTNLPSAESFPSLQELEVSSSSKEMVDKSRQLELKDSCKFTISPALDDE